MHGGRRRVFSAALALALIAPASVASAAKERVLFSFLGFNGAYPRAGVALDAAGNVYGTTEEGGPGSTSQGYGIVYRLTPTQRGHWRGHVLHAFGGKNDGIFPTSGVMVDGVGNVYGAVSNGGAGNSGIVYELSPANGRFRYRIIHAFSGMDGSYPDSALVMDAAGNLYGTTVSGGPGGSLQAQGSVEGAGVVYRLRPQSGGSWKDKTLNVFNVDESLNPNSPYAPVLIGSDGTLYGTTEYGGVECPKGGAMGCGTAFALTTGSSKPKLTDLHAFAQENTDGYFPVTGLVADGRGNLFGAVGGGLQMGGVIYELSPTKSGPWTETIVRAFVPGSGPDGYGPGGLVFDKGGNLWGTQGGGGKYGGGVLFEMRPQPSGKWSYTVVYTFGRNQDAAGPLPDALVLDRAGNLYGAAFEGGEDNVGAVFEVTP